MIPRAPNRMNGTCQKREKTIPLRFLSWRGRRDRSGRWSVIVRWREVRRRGNFAGRPEPSDDPISVVIGCESEWRGGEKLTDYTTLVLSCADSFLSFLDIPDMAQKCVFHARRGGMGRIRR
jgi:hypothetical protein